jgi:hypothetical protein
MIVLGPLVIEGVKALAAKLHGVDDVRLSLQVRNNGERSVLDKGRPLSDTLRLREAELPVSSLRGGTVQLVLLAPEVDKDDIRPVLDGISSSKFGRHIINIESRVGNDVVYFH